MKNQLSKREYKYRCKIIAENHLKKNYQIYLDSYVDSKWLTYKDVYGQMESFHTAKECLEEIKARTAQTLLDM